MILPDVLQHTLLQYIRDLRYNFLKDFLRAPMYLPQEWLTVDVWMHAGPVGLQSATRLDAEKVDAWMYARPGPEMLNPSVDAERLMFACMMQGCHTPNSSPPLVSPHPPVGWGPVVVCFLPTSLPRPVVSLLWWAQHPP